MLFKNSELHSNIDGQRSLSIKDKCNSYITDSLSLDLASQIGELKDGQSYHYDTINDWSTHDILLYCLSQTIPSEVFITTWAIKEYPARIISNLKADGIITKLNLLIDYRIPVTSPDAYILLEKSADSLHLTRIHAKLTVIQNEEMSMTIVSTSNYTQNTRAEVGVITISKEVADKRINWIQSQYK